MRSAIERNLEIVGESLLRLQREDQFLCNRITDYRGIIGLRNRLAHGYGSEIDHEAVWEIVKKFVPTLLAEASVLLAEAE